jgi:ferredoxin
MQKIAVNDLDRLYSAIAQAMRLYLPVEVAGEVEFRPYDGAAKVRLDALQTVKSAKDAFFPISEDLMKFHKEQKSFTIEPGKELDEDFAILGVRACDARSFSILDHVFLTEPRDGFYAARREHGIVVSLACSRPEETCFCQTFGIDPTNPEGDVVTWLADGNLYWEPKTEKGQKLTDLVKDVLTDAEDVSAVEKQQASVRDILKKLPIGKLNLDYFTSTDQLEIFHRPEWEELSQGCLGCGTCTFVCPTCQCYDIRDFNNGDGQITRYRCWDSCMYSDFTLMAAVNSRKTQMQRFRQRFMHKLVYAPLNKNEFSCVGCGRCLRKCPVGKNIVKVAKKIGGDAQ